MVVHTHSIATVSWIDSRTGLPEFDATPPGETVSRAFLTGNRGFRFVNFLEASVSVEDSQLVDFEFTHQSGIYRGPSYGGIPSEYFEPIRRTHPAPASQQTLQPVSFKQTIGARTVSPETIAQDVGFVIPGSWLGFPAGAVAHRMLGFPPIWTEIEMTIRPDGSFDGRVFRYSKFPSMTFYVQQGSSTTYERVDQPYDARRYLEHWKENGWGRIRVDAGGAQDGNPWSIRRQPFWTRPVQH